LKRLLEYQVITQRRRLRRVQEVDIRISKYQAEKVDKTRPREVLFWSPDFLIPYASVRVDPDLISWSPDIRHNPTLSNLEQLADTKSLK
jgi:hypothetical protein